MEEYATPSDFETRPTTTMKARFEAFFSGPYFIVCIIVLVAVIAFCLGKFISIENNREPVKLINSSVNNSLEAMGTIQNSDNPTSISNSKSKAPTISAKSQTATVVNSTPNTVVADNTEVVASKNGTKYHLPTCPGAKQISAANKITFPSISAARSAGLTPALNCKGLK